MRIYIETKRKWNPFAKRRTLSIIRDYDKESGKSGLIFDDGFLLETTDGYKWHKVAKIQ